MIAYETTRERVLVGCFLNWFIKYIVKSSNEKAQRETKILHESIANLVFCYRKSSLHVDAGTQTVVL